jgi:hypothetical protein
MSKVLKCLTLSASMLALVACNTGKAAQSQEDWTMLKMANTVLTYVDKCENRSAPGHYVDKAAKIWDAATTADRKVVTAEMAKIVQQWPVGEVCQQLGVGVRLIVTWDFKIPERSPFDVLEPSVDTSKLSAKITRIENSGSEYFYPLIVVENKSDQSFSYTNWSCTFYNGDEPVHEDTFSVNNVSPQSKTARKSITHSKARFDTTSCRLLTAR